MAKTKRKKTGSGTLESGRPAILPEKKPGLLVTLGQLSPARTILLICLVSFLAYANSLGGEFVFDDTDVIVENQDIRSWDNLGKAFTTHVWAFRERPGTINPPPLPYYRPLFTITLTVGYHLFGLWPQGWHLVSLLLHILCAAGVFYLILLMSGRNLPALFASLIFAVHPVHAESVSWVSGMTDPLFGVFFFASLCLYLKARSRDERRRANRRLLLLSLAMFVLAAFAKETALSLAVLIFAYEFVEASGRTAERLIEAAKRTIPFAAAALVYLAPRYLVLGELMWKNPQAPDRPLSYTLLTLPSVVCRYIGHLVWPFGLSVTYNTYFVTSPASALFLWPVAALGLGLAALFLYRKRVSREVWKGLLLIFVPLLPVLKLGQVSQEEYLVFDHYLYLPVAGLAYLIAIGLLNAGAFQSNVTERNIDKAQRRAAFAARAFAVIVVLFTIAAARENRPWADSYSLWSNVARARPTYWKAHYNAGLALLDAKRFDEARRSLERAAAIELDEPNIADALGRANDGLGEMASAVASFKRAIAIDPEMFESYNNLGAVYFRNKDYALAEVNFVAALRLRPDASASRFNLGLCYAREGRYSDATGELERAVQAAPGDAEALYELGLAYERTGRGDDAARAFQRGQLAAKSQGLADKITEGLDRIRRP